MKCKRRIIQINQRIPTSLNAGIALNIILELDKTDIILKDPDCVESTHRQLGDYLYIHSQYFLEAVMKNSAFTYFLLLLNPNAPGLKGVILR